MDSDLDGGIDLHIHTTASDGSHTPNEILHMAAQKGLRAVAITDHDTIEGARLAAKGKCPEALYFLPGVEISTQAPPQNAVSGSLHILGYGIDLDNRPLQRALDKLQQARSNRTPQIVDRLNRLGVNISLDQVMAEVGQGAAGRPHVATVLIKMGLVDSIDEAFDRYLGKNGPAYVDKERLDCHLAFDLIRKAGGIPVLAHPYLVRCDPQKGLENLVVRLSQMGLMGIEAYYPNHSLEVVANLLEIARDHGLLVTGGTDFHGEVTPGIQMGTGRDDVHVPFVLYEKLMAAIERQKKKNT